MNIATWIAVIASFCAACGESATGGSLGYIRTPVPDGESAFHLVTNAMMQLSPLRAEMPQEASYEPEYWATHPEAGKKVAAWADAHATVVDILHKAVCMRTLQCPERDDAVSAPSMFLSWHSGAKTLCAVARERGSRGDYSGSCAIALDIVRWGRLLSESEQGILSYIAGVSIQKVGLDQLQCLVEKPGMSMALLEQILSTIPPAEVTSPALARATAVECSGAIAMFAPVFSGAAHTSALKVGQVSIFDPTATVRLCKGFYARAVTNALVTWPCRDTAILHDWTNIVPAAAEGLFTSLGSLMEPFFIKACTNLLSKEEIDSLLAGTLTDAEAKSNVARNAVALGAMNSAGAPDLTNIVGRLLVQCTANKAMSSAHLRSVLERTRINLIRAAAMIRASELKTNQLPATLPPDPGTHAAPMDLFADAPLRYSRDKRMLWSVGADGRDDNGERENDIVVRLPEK